VTDLLLVAPSSTCFVTHIIPRAIRPSCYLLSFSVACRSNLHRKCRLRRGCPFACAMLSCCPFRGQESCTKTMSHLCDVQMSSVNRVLLPCALRV
jgi:hypothetical protein